MADGLIIEFQGVDRSRYEAVNEQLGIDMETGDGDWPAGLLSHAAGTADTGAFTVIEIWDSQASQGKFMESRLGPALAAAGAPAPSRITWVPLLAYHTPSE
jgi:hypothetical protein